MKIDFGWFDKESQTYPTFDPGLEVNCPVCGLTLSPEVVTLSVMRVGSPRSYFYRVDKGCYEGLSDDQKTALDSVIVDDEKIP